MPHRSQLNPTPQQLSEWQRRASRKNALLPEGFSVTPRRIEIRCGKCGKEFGRTLVAKRSEPVFVCPSEGCRARNWIPLQYDAE